MSSPNTQVKLKLTTNRDVLTALRHVGALRNAGDTKNEFLALQFNALEYRFHHGVELIVPEPVAEGLYRSSGVLIGDSLTGTQQPGIEVVEKWELGQVEPSRSKTLCPICNEEQGSVKKLTSHLASHVEEDEEEEEPEPEQKPKGNQKGK